jgi:hypothetical protein
MGMCAADAPLVHQETEGGGGLSTKPRRNRREGSLGTLKRYLWVAVCYNLEVIEDTERPHILRQKASNALVQASMAYLKVTEQVDVLPRLEALEEAMKHGNSQQ